MSEPKEFPIVADQVEGVLSMNREATILVVDDSVSCLSQLVAILTKVGYRVFSTDSGEQALCYVTEYMPDLLLLDVCMPGIDGLEVCRRLKVQEDTQNIPIILISGLTTVQDWAEGLRAGAVDYITKPFQIDELLARIKTQLALREASRSIERQAASLRLSNEQLRQSLAEAECSRQAMLDTLEDRQRVAQALQEYEERFATAFLSSPVSMSITSTTTESYVEVNEMFLRNSGFSREEIIGHTSAELQLFYDPTDRDRLFAEIRRQGFAYCLQLRYRMKDGEVRDGLISAQLIQLHGEPHLLATILDVTERTQADNRLRESEEKFRCLFNASRDAIVTLDPTSLRFAGGNPAAVAMFAANSFSELIELGPTDLSPEKQPDGRLSSERARDIVATTMQKGSTSFEWMHKRVDGQEFLTTVLLTRMEMGGRSFLQGTIRDISELKRVEIELEHARKLEAVGQLAAGIAHEINTPTQYVGDNVHFLEEAWQGYRRLLGQYRRAVEVLAEAGGHEALLSEIRETEDDIDLVYLDANVPGSFTSCKDGVSRISTIVRAMKEFAHPDQKEKAYADLNQALQTTLAIAKNEYKYVAEVTTDLGDLPPVLCHVGDLNQVFLNLIVNAAHAIGDVVGQEGRKGNIRIITLREGELVRIEITDTGSGIPEGIRHRIFEPFFTTKEVGKGSGQGLAIARSIVIDKHGGVLSYESEMGKGTTFTIRLPIDGKPAGHEDRSPDFFEERRT